MTTIAQFPGELLTKALVRYVEVPGDDPPLIWLHGWQCSSTGELLPAAVQPSLQGRRSLLVDLCERMAEVASGALLGDVAAAADAAVAGLGISRTNVEADVGPNQQWNLDVQLANPEDWAMVVAQGEPGLNPNVHCVLAVDGVVVKTHQGPKGALCSIRNW